VFVSDLRHFLGMPEDAPGPAKRMAEQLSSIVRAATSGSAEETWTSALPCMRRPGRRPCPGRIRLLRSADAVHWSCDACGDDGVIRGWEDSPYDLRLRRPVAQPGWMTVPVPAEVAATLREIIVLDTETERYVFRARATPDGAELLGTIEDLDELVGFVAAEANHEESRRRQKRLDQAFALLNDALAEMPDA